MRGLLSVLLLAAACSDPIQLLLPDLQGATVVVVAFEAGDRHEVTSVEAYAPGELLSRGPQPAGTTLVHLLAYDLSPSMLGFSFGPLLPHEGPGGVPLPRPAIGRLARLESSSTPEWEPSDEPSMGLASFTIDPVRSASCAPVSRESIDLRSNARPVALKNSARISEAVWLVLMEDGVLLGIDQDNRQQALTLTGTDAAPITAIEATAEAIWIADRRGRIGIAEVRMGSSEATPLWNTQFPSTQAIQRFDVRATLSPVPFIVLTASAAVWLSTDNRWRVAKEFPPAPEVDPELRCGSIALRSNDSLLAFAAAPGEPGALLIDPTTDSSEPLGATSAQACYLGVDIRFEASPVVLGTTDGKILWRIQNEWQELLDTGRGAPITAIAPLGQGLVFADASGAVGRVSSDRKLCWTEPLFAPSTVQLAVSDTFDAIMAAGLGPDGKPRAVNLKLVP